MTKDEYALLVIPQWAGNDIVSNFKQLNRHSEFISYPLSEKRDKLIRCINILYSAKSPLIKLYKDDLQVRKEESAILAGFDPKNKSEWEWVTENLFMFKTSPVTKDQILSMVVRFLIIQNNKIAERWQHGL